MKQKRRSPTYAIIEAAREKRGATCFRIKGAHKIAFTGRKIHARQAKRSKIGGKTLVLQYIGYLEGEETTTRQGTTPIILPRYTKTKVPTRN